jgi:large subunit ribosomal protein L13
MKTYAPKPSDIERRWYVIDASGAVLGRLASEVAQILKGKHKPIYAPHADTGDHVIVINASGVTLTGGKETKKIAYRHSGYPGGLTETRYDRLLAERPAYAVQKAVRGMLPKNSLGRSMLKKLQIYPGPEHVHQAQKPEPLRLGELPKWEGLPVPAEKPETTRSEPTKPSSKLSVKRVSAKAPAKKAPAKRSPASKKVVAKKSVEVAAKPAAPKPARAPKAETAAKAPKSEKTDKVEKKPRRIVRKKSEE